MAQARLVLKSFPGSRLLWEAWGWWLSLSFKAEFLLTQGRDHRAAVVLGRGWARSRGGISAQRVPAE